MREWLEQLLGDARVAIRRLRRSPWYTAIVLSTLVVGIASVTAIFSFTYSVYWRPLPYKNADRIVAVVERRADHRCCYNEVTTSVAREIIAQNRAFDRVALWDESGSDMAIADDARSISILLADTSMQAMLGIRPMLGRLLSAEEIIANAPVALLNERLWRAAFGGDSALIGRRIHVGSEDLVVVGILPSAFGFPRQTDLLRPLPPSAVPLAINTADGIGLLAHLRPSARRDAALAEMNTLATNLTRDAVVNGKTRLAFMPEMLDRRANAFPLPSLFIGASTLLLLIACANVMNLVLMRAAERRGEMAVRASLGADRARLLRLAFTEVGLLSIVAGVLGIAGSILILKITLLLLPTVGFPYWLRFGLDPRILAFVVAVVALVLITVGLTPAREGTRFDLARALKVGGDGGVIGGDVAATSRRALAIQLALSMALFIGAALFARSYRNSAAVDVGYPADHVLDFALFFNARYPDYASRLRTTTDLASALARAPEIDHAAVRGYSGSAIVGSAADIPFAQRKPDPGPRDARLLPEGDSTRGIGLYSSYPSIREFSVTEGYFDALRLRMVSGRAINAQDIPGRELAAVVSERLAEQLWPKQLAMGHTLRRGAKGEMFTVVGVVQNVRDIQGGSRGLRADPRGDVYYSAHQVETWNPELVAHSSASLPIAEKAAKAALHRIDPQLIARAESIGNTGEAKLIATVFGTIIGLFSAAGLLLSVMGLYGVIAYGIHRRRREVGIRIALGATTELIVRMFVRQSLRFIGAGLVAGLFLAGATSRLAAIVLFQVSPLDVSVYSIACAVFAAVALFGSWLPARRAATINPVAALKSE